MLNQRAEYRSPFLSPQSAIGTGVLAEWRDGSSGAACTAEDCFPHNFCTAPHCNLSLKLYIRQRSDAKDLYK
jgi:hypothetical protein